MEDVAGLGKRGDVVKVALGHARNYLIPFSKAKIATPAALKLLEQEKKRDMADREDKLTKAKELADKLSYMTITLEASSGTAGKKEVKSAEGSDEKLYGAITAADILHALTSRGIRIEKKDIHIEEPIRKLGSYEVPLRLHREVKTVLKLNVVKKK